MDKTYYTTFHQKYKNCKSKKDYKKLCKEMISLYNMIDKMDENQWKIFSSVMGEDAYAQGIALALKMSILEMQGVSYDILTCEQNWDG